MVIEYNKLKEDLNYPDRWYLSDDKLERINREGDVLYYFMIPNIDKVFGFTNLELIYNNNTVELTFFQKRRLVKSIREIKPSVIMNQQVHEDVSQLIGQTFFSGATSFFPFDAAFDDNIVMGVDPVNDEVVTTTRFIKPMDKNNNQDFKDKINLEKERIRKILGKDKMSDNK